MIKKFSLFLLIIISLSFCINSVYADCSECDISDCASCGCKLSSNGESCIYDNYSNEVESCGNELITNIPASLPKFTSIVYSIIHVLIPILLVIFGSLDLVKGIIAQKDDDIKKGQQLLIKRLIAAALVFFVFVIVKFLISIVADNNSTANSTRILQCAECFITGECKQIIDNGWYSGPIATSGPSGYFENGYQPQDIKVKGEWKLLKFTGKYYFTSRSNSKNENIEVSEKLYSFDNSGTCYWWDIESNEYKSISCNEGKDFSYFYYELFKQVSSLNGNYMYYFNTDIYSIRETVKDLSILSSEYKPLLNRIDECIESGCHENVYQAMSKGQGIETVDDAYNIINGIQAIASDYAIHSLDKYLDQNENISDIQFIRDCLIVIGGSWNNNPYQDILNTINSCSSQNECNSVKNSLKTIVNNYKYQTNIDFN